MEILSSAQSFRITVGKSKNQKIWRDVREVTWAELCHVLTDHQIGEKDGSCFVPAVFSGTKRAKNEASVIGLLVLDCDTGEPLEQIKDALQKTGWAAIIYSTHSHLTEETEIARKSYDEKGYNDPAQYLIHEKGVQESVAAGAYITESGDPKKVIVKHNPCPKFRVVMPLALPWTAAEFTSQDAANAIWSQFVKQTAKILGLHHDQSCIDSSRLYYFPRHPEGAAFETAILEGMLIDPRTVIGSNTNLDCTEAKQKIKRQERDFIYTSTETGAQFNLVDWAARYAESFDIVGVLKAKQSGIFTGHVTDGYKHHIHCVNGDQHTSQESDNATFIISPMQSQTGSFVHCCMHAHCRDKDRLFFILKMLENGWLDIIDLGIENEACGLSFDEVRQLCESLHQGSSPDETKAVLDQLVKAKLDPLHVEFLLSVIRDKTKTNLKTLRDSMAAAKEKSSVDAAYFIVQKTLDAYFAGGTHLIRAEDKSFWRYNGKCWETLRNEVAGNYVLTMVKKYAVPSHGEDYHKMTRHALDLLITRQALDIEFFKRLGEIPSVINCQNGELWLHPDGSTELRPHSPTSYLQYVLEFDFNPNATCPVFDQALYQTFANATDPEGMVRHMQEMMGYFIQPGRFLTSWFMWQGGGSNGKTTLFETLERLMSRSSIYSERIENLEKNRFSLGSLMGKALFVDDDISENTIIPDGILKKLSERKLITGEKKFKDTFEYISSVAVLLLANNSPRCNDLSYGTRWRVRIVPFMQKFQPSKENPSPYPYIFQHEMSGVLNRLVQGLQRLRQRGDFLEPIDCVIARDNWLKHANPFSAFVSECCLTDRNFHVELLNVVNKFESWQMENRFYKKMSSQDIRLALEALGYSAKRINGRWRIYGIMIA